MTLSPLISRADWGRIEVAGSVYKDVKLWPGGAREWNWTEHGTSHAGVQPLDVDEILDRGCAVVVVSTGRGGRLEVGDATRARIREGGAELEVLGTEEAVLRYNQLAGEGVAVGALIHTTC